jgi:hypothetical protein
MKIETACGLVPDGEHSRYPLCGAELHAVIQAIHDGRMSQLPTNPILAALARPNFGPANRRISAGLTVDAAPGPRSLNPQLLQPPNESLDTSPVISTGNG